MTFLCLRNNYSIGYQGAILPACEYKFIVSAFYVSKRGICVFQFGFSRGCALERICGQWQGTVDERHPRFICGESPCPQPSALPPPPPPPVLGGEAQNRAGKEREQRASPRGAAAARREIPYSTQPFSTPAEDKPVPLFGCFVCLMSGAEPPFPARAPRLPSPQPPVGSRVISARPRRGAPGSLLQIRSL